MSYRSQNPMQCACGKEALILEVYFPGTDRETTICHYCHPDSIRTELRAFDSRTNTVVHRWKNLMLRWGSSQEEMLEHVRIHDRDGIVDEEVSHEDEPTPGIFGRLLRRLSWKTA